MGTPDFAVVIPTIGRESLERALRSVAAQTTPPLQVIVVTNGRTRLAPAREEALSGIVGPISLSVVSLPPFSGPSICRNMGAWMAETSHVAFLDDDDEYDQTYLATMAEHIERHDPGLLYAAKEYRNNDGTTRKIVRIQSLPRQPLLEKLYCHHNHGFGGQNLVARRHTFFELGGFAVDIPSGEDRAFVMAALRTDTVIGYVNEAVVVCHDPDGYRARRHGMKWISNLKIMRDHWDAVSLSVRLRSTYRLLRHDLKR